MENHITLSELADRLGVSLQALYGRIKRGTLKAEKKDGTWYVHQTVVEQVDAATEAQDKVCKTCERWKERFETSDEQVKYLKERIEKLEMLLERHTLLLAQERSDRLKLLESPFKRWFSRLIGQNAR
jgi:predicted DNA-binding protein YlxM (UPF0122 family)